MINIPHQHLCRCDSCELIKAAHRHAQAQLALDMLISVALAAQFIQPGFLGFRLSRKALNTTR